MEYRKRKEVKNNATKLNRKIAKKPKLVAILNKLVTTIPPSKKATNKTPVKIKPRMMLFFNAVQNVRKTGISFSRYKR